PPAVLRRGRRRRAGPRGSAGRGGGAVGDPDRAGRRLLSRRALATARPRFRDAGEPWTAHPAGRHRGHQRPDAVASFTWRLGRPLSLERFAPTCLHGVSLAARSGERFVCWAGGDRWPT